ncbi:hypothetical protein ZWY2020_050023 [Hordeum vulgare]|nr:hypothetical protein ZWY2020_050023 [Hordeum vulgare]
MSAAMVNLSQAQNSPQDYVSPHNAARSAVGVGAVSWSTKLQAFAQNYANQRINDCKLQHSGGPYGENIFWGSAGADWKASDAVNSWVSEKKDYDYGSNTCAAGKVCGHYTQDGDMDDVEFDKALYDLYVTHKVNRLKHKLSCAAARNVVLNLRDHQMFLQHPPSQEILTSFFSSCIAGLSPRQKSCEKFSCSRGRDVATSKIPFANNTTTSEVNAPAGSNVSFAYKVESAYASCLGNEIIDLVQKSNADKPIIFQDWSESLVLNVLGLIGDAAFKSPVRSRVEYPLDSKADSPTFKNSGSHNLPGCKSVPIESTKKTSNDPSVSKLARNVMPDDCAKTNLSIPPLGTFASPPSIVPSAPVSVLGYDVRPDVSHRPIVFSKGSSPTTSLFAMPVAMPTSIPSGSPLKRRKPNVGMISNVRPFVSRFKSDCASKDDHCVKKADQIIGSSGVDFEFHPATRNHSPLLPVRLSQRFIDDIDRVQCLQYVSERIINSPKTPFEQDILCATCF